MSSQPAAETIRVTGYHRGGYECGHCGRELLHCIATDRGVFGAACLSQTMTRPQKYMGRSFRLSTSAMISLARMARDPARNGVSAQALTFELVGA